ncbi:DUF7109 family protein [Halarchaeum sp. P4]|uniref:DUF7109 family protein n=1 Tax=Halarchaeum sp. P4 TaxID=3421639 RepID=UPI003EB77CBB
MDLDPDELAGVCDLFGGLTRAELATAVEELAFRRGVDFECETHDAAVEAAREAYALVVLEASSEDDALDAYVRSVLDDAGLDASTPLVVPGPRAFPVVPDGGADLPHILDVERRDVPEDALEAAIRERLESEVAALADGDLDPSRADLLLDVTYDAEASTGGDFECVRAELDAYV